MASKRRSGGDAADWLGNGQLPSPGHRHDGQIDWLDPRQVGIRQDAHGRLVLQVGSQSYCPVQPAKLFALSEPDRYVAFRDADGEELGIVRDLAELDASSREVLADHLRKQYFIPIIRRVLKIEEYFIDQTWTVETDRGRREFTIQGRDSIRFLSDSGMLLMDMNDSRYLLPDRRALDPASRRWVDRFVW